MPEAVSSLNHSADQPARNMDMVAIAFCAAVAMWIGGYVLHIPLAG